MAAPKARADVTGDDSSRSGAATGSSLHRLIATGVTKQYNGVAVIEDVDLSVREGEFVAILGPSGAGKTTLFRCIAGLQTMDCGRVDIGGLDLAAIRGRRRRRVAIVFQHYNLVGRMNALDNVLAGRLGHVPAWRGILRRFERRNRLLALECLDRVGLLAHASAYAGTLSGGQRQSVAIARALAQQPDVIIADEPVASLDPTAAAGVLDLLRSIARKDGVGVIFSLHQTQLAPAYSDRIVGRVRGRVVFDGAARTFDSAASDMLYDRAVGMPLSDGNLRSSVFGLMEPT